MKKFLGILFMGLLLAGNIYADMKMLPKGTTVNQLIKDGYTLIDTELHIYMYISTTQCLSF